MPHPFHPLFGREFELVKRRRNWRVDRVYFFDAAGALVSGQNACQKCGTSDAIVRPQCPKP
ncbi:MAG: DUF5372 family protein [Haloechinothrix sp.]